MTMSEPAPVHGTDVADVDDAFLAKAQELLGTTTPRDTVNTALREVVRIRLVHEYLDSMSGRDPQELDALRAQAWQ
ncbi:MAG TPA: type II toxin-antitoxin system VapB family antitoxin [Mycobacteriales bacterium]|jgi:Arc/MetJ family transcription regulator|nr:type II toxin-antitoxin system VapB family antitoxin [Mycobacteriales bacterium]